MKKIVTFILIFVIVISSVFATGNVVNKGVSTTFGFTFQGNGSSTKPESIKDNFFRSTINFGLDYNINEMFSFGVLTKTKYHSGFGVGVSDVAFDASAHVRLRGCLGNTVGNLGFYADLYPAGIEVQIINGEAYTFYTFEVSAGWDLRVTPRCLAYVELGIQAVDYTSYPTDRGYVSEAEGNKGSGFLECTKAYGEINIGLKYFL